MKITRRALFLPSFGSCVASLAESSCGAIFTQHGVKATSRCETHTLCLLLFGSYKEGKRTVKQKPLLQCLLVLTLVIPATVHSADGAGKERRPWSTSFSPDKADLVAIGKNTYFILLPSFRLFLEHGKDSLVIHVLNETKMVDGVETRVVEERETKDGKLVEVSRNYFAISKTTGDVYYFGEDVDTYKVESTR